MTDEREAAVLADDTCVQPDAAVDEDALRLAEALVFAAAGPVTPRALCAAAARDMPTPRR